MNYPMPVELWPDAVAARPRHLECGEGFSATLILTGYPAELPAAWLEGLSSAATHVDCAIHIDPVPPATAASQLKKRRARLESARRFTANRDKLDEPAVEAAATDAADLAGRIARGEARLFTTAVYITVHARSLDELDAACLQVKAAADAGLLDVRPATFRQLPGITSTLPLGVDAVGATRSLDTDTTSAAFPFASADAPQAPGGVLYGLNTATGAPVMWNRWAQDNHNSIVLARSGAGKSYFTKTEILRQLYDGVHVAVIDPDGEYHHLASHVDGTVTRVGTTHLNPLQLPAEPGPDALTRRIMFVHTLAATMLGGDLTPDEAAVLDDVLLAVYAAFGITTDPATWHHTPPTLDYAIRWLTNSANGAMRHMSESLSRSSNDSTQDLAVRLKHFDTDTARRLAARLAPFVNGGLSGLFDGEPAPAPSGHFVVFDLGGLPDELTAAGTLLVLDAIQSGLTADGTRRLVVVDEAWRLLSTGDGAAFLARLAKSARKKGAGLMTVTQDVDDVLGTELGRVVIANAASQILMRQAPQVLPTVAEAFRLTDAESDTLATARQGEALLLSGDTHVAFAAITSPAEHDLCLTGLPRGES